MVYSPVMNAFRLSGQEAGGMPDWAKAMSQGFQGAADVYKPRKASEDLLAQMLTNKMNKPKADHAEEIESLGRQLQQAQINKANRGPATVYSNLEKAMQGYDRIKQQYGEGSPEAEQAKTYVQRLAQGSQGFQLTTDPETGALTSVSFGGSSRGGPQSALTTDAEGNKVVVSKPTMAQSTAQQKSSLSEIGRASIAKKAEMPYIGSGSNAEILKDRLNYTEHGDQAAGDRLVKAAVAKMIAPEYAGYQLASQGIQATIPAQKHQFETIKQGWPISVDAIVDNLPKELQAKAKTEHAKLLAEIKKARETHAAQGYPVKVGESAKPLKYNIETGRLE